MSEIIVTTTADSGAGSLRQAIADAQDGDVILFDPLVFPEGETTTILLASQLSLAADVTIDAGTPERYYVVIREVEGAATEVVIDDDHPAQEGETPQLRLACRVALDGQNACRCILTSSTLEKLATIHGVAFVNGSATNYGGAIYTQKTSVDLTECTFSGNSATTNGGAVCSGSSSQNTLTVCAFSGNSATSGGAVCSASTSQNTLTDCTFSGNSATNYGGAVYSYGTSQNTLTACTFSGNNAAYGGAAYSYGTSQNTFDGCTFSGNACVSDATRRDIVVADQSAATIVDSTYEAFRIGPDASATIAGGITTVGTLTLTASGGNAPTITFIDGAALAVTTAATIPAGATFTSETRGYLRVPYDTDVSAAAFNNVKVQFTGAPRKWRLDAWDIKPWRNENYIAGNWADKEATA